MLDIKAYPSDLQKQIENDIRHGSLATGSEIPVSQIAERYNASVDAFERIIPTLYRKGLINKPDGEIFCVSGLPQAKIESVFQFAEKAKLSPSTVVREVSVIAADDFLSKKLNVESGEAMYQQVRTRLIDEQVIANQYNFIPYTICPGLETIDLSQRSFQATLAQEYSTIVKRIEETYVLGAPSRDDASVLDLPAEANVLIVERMSFSASDMPLVFADIHVNPSAFHYVKNLWPGAEKLISTIQENKA